MYASVCLDGVEMILLDLYEILYLQCIQESEEYLSSFLIQYNHVTRYSFSEMVHCVNTWYTS